jgi:hypothetical protein
MNQKHHRKRDKNLPNYGLLEVKSLDLLLPYIPIILFIGIKRKDLTYESIPSIIILMEAPS